MIGKEMILMAVAFSSFHIGIVVILLIKFYYKIKDEIHKNTLRNSTYSLLEMSIWDLRKEKKDLEAKLKEAMNDSIRAHSSLENIASKLQENGSGL